MNCLALFAAKVALATPEVDMLVVYDTETTGVDNTTRIVELASITILDGVMYEFVERCNPGIPIPAGASAVHGIYDHDVADCRSDDVVVADWLKRLSDMSQTTEIDVVMAGHNQQFDARMVNMRQKIPFDLSLCSLQLARKHGPHEPNHKLETVYKNLGLVGSHNAHSALDDVRMTMEIISTYCQQLGKGYIDLAREQCKPSLLATMPFGKHKGKQMEDVPQSYMRYMLGLPDLDRNVRHTFEQLVS